MNINKEHIDILIYSPTNAELIEVQKFLPNAQLDKSHSNKNFQFLFDKGSIKHQQKEYIIHVISPDRQGQPEARDLLTNALKVWSPTILILVGVAGGFKDRGINIGDIILPNLIIVHELVKATPDGEFPQPDYRRTTNYLVNAAERFFNRCNWSERISIDYFKHLSKKIQKVSCYADGHILSGPTLLARDLDEKDAIKKLKESNYKLYAIEQEAGEIGRILENSNIPWLDIRVTMDTADPETRVKDIKEINKQQASEIAAKFTFDFLKWYVSKEPSIFTSNTILFNSFNKFDMESILKDEHIIPFRPEGPQIIDFEKGNWIYIPKIAEKIVKSVHEGNIVILGGKPATGKSVICRYVGYNSLKENKNSVFYIDFTNLIEKDINTILHNLDNLIINQNFSNLKINRNTPLFIFENIHDPLLNRLQRREKSFITSLKACNHKIKILLTTRENLDSFTWIKNEDQFNLNELSHLNKELIYGIIDKFRHKRKAPIKWDFKESPENLWLLGWTLRVLDRTPDNKFKFGSLNEISNRLQIEIKKYYKRYFPEVQPEKLITILLILSILSVFEIYMESDFLLKKARKYFKGLELEESKKIIKLLVERREIYSKKIEVTHDPSIVGYEYRIPHIKLAEIIQDCYSDELLKEKLLNILKTYITSGKNTGKILGYNIWLQNDYEYAALAYGLKEKEQKFFVELGPLINKFKVSKNHIIMLDMSNKEIKEIPTGLNFFTELEELYLYNNKIKEIKGINNLKKLKILDFSNNHIEEIKGLSRLTKLEILNLGQNRLDEIKGFENLKNLRKLYFANLFNIDYDIYDSKTNFDLFLKRNKIREIKNLQNAINLEYLDLRANQIKDIKGLERLTNLKSVNLKFNPINKDEIYLIHLSANEVVKYCKHR